MLENSQVLKGEAVPCDEVWAGLPASSCELRAKEVKEVKEVKEEGTEATEEKAQETALFPDSVFPSLCFFKATDEGSEPMLGLGRCLGRGLDGLGEGGVGRQTCPSCTYTYVV